MIGTFNYTLIEENKLYFYEEVSDNQTVQLMVFDNKPLNNAEFAVYQQENMISRETKSVNDIMRSSIPITVGKLDNGIAARLEITDSSNSYFTGTIQTPTRSQISQIDNTNTYNYIYSGFSGPNIETDLGLQWSLKEPSIGGWNHMFILWDGATRHGTFNPEYNQVTGSNFFLTSTSSSTMNINFTAYKNYSGKVRSTLSGYARYNSSSGGTPGNYWMTSVMEYTKSVGTINYWKVVDTISPVVPDNVPSGASSWCKFSNIRLDGSSPNINRMHIKTYYADANYTLSGNYLNTLEFSLYK